LITTGAVAQVEVTVQDHGEGREWHPRRRQLIHAISRNGTGMRRCLLLCEHHKNQGLDLGPGANRFESFRKTITLAPLAEARAQNAANSRAPYPRAVSRIGEG
jgi:hypothetical protein